jgi:hypothetical protein
LSIKDELVLYEEAGLILLTHLNYQNGDITPCACQHKKGSQRGVYMSGYKVEELYREIGEYKARIDVYITAQGYYEVTAVFLDNPGTSR